jgi:hypothetical protein
MGLARDLMRNVSGQSEFVSVFRRLAESMESDERSWIAALRQLGVKAAHPDDGWVDRELNTVFFAYPQFDDGVSVGDVIALGWPAWNDGESRTRLVRVTGRTVGLFQQRWAFEPVLLTEREAG